MDRCVPAFSPTASLDPALFHSPTHPQPHSPPLFHSNPSSTQTCVPASIWVTVDGQFSHSQSGEEEVKGGRIQPPDDYERRGNYYQVRSQ